MPESIQHKFERVRSPRVHLTYDVEIGDTIKSIEIPFIVGVLADLSGKPDQPLPKMKDRKFIEIDRDNFDMVLAGMNPRLAFRVDNKLTGDDTKMAVELSFKSMEDFHPERIADQVASLRKLVESRQRLSDLLSKMDGNDRLDELLQDVTASTDKVEQLAREAGVEKSAAAGGEAAEAETAKEEMTLLDQIIEEGKMALDESHWVTAKDLLGEFVSQIMEGVMVVSKDTEAMINSGISQIDKLISDQLNEIMHHSDFQKLEGSWRGLNYLVLQSETGEHMKIRVMNASKKDLLKDLEKAAELDQSTLFKKIYEAEFGTFGGSAYGALIGDFEISNHPQDMSFIKNMAQVAAAAHAPFISAAAPQLMGFESFTQLGEYVKCRSYHEQKDSRDADLDRPHILIGHPYAKKNVNKIHSLAKDFESVSYTQWNSFRRSPNSLYVGLTLPHILMRLPYGPNTTPVEAFDFVEEVDGADHSKYLWGNSAYAFGACLTNAFAKYRWCAAIQGVEGGGLVEGLPMHTYPTDDGEVGMKCPTEIAITDQCEEALSEIGLIPIVYCKGTDYAVFVSVQSCHGAKMDSSAASNDDARLSTQLSYVLAISRFVHYLRAIMRDRIGRFQDKKACEDHLNHWLASYVLLDDNGSAYAQAKNPLREAHLKVSDVPGRAGIYQAEIFIKPRYQIDARTALHCTVAELPKRVRRGQEGDRHDF